MPQSSNDVVPSDNLDPPESVVEFCLTSLSCLTMCLEQYKEELAETAKKIAAPGKHRTFELACRGQKHLGDGCRIHAARGTFSYLG